MSKYTNKMRRDLARHPERYADEEADAVPVPVERAIQRAAKDPLALSKQPHFSSQAGIFASVYRWIRQAALEEPLYASDSGTRDKWLREFVQREPHLAGVLNSVTQVDGNRGWTLTGGRNQVNKYTTILHDNYFVTTDTLGWRPGIKSAAQSYYSSDMGAVVEIGRDGAGGPLRALYHVDSARCRLSGRPDAPLQYRPLAGGQQDWTADDYFRVSSMVSSDEALRGLGFCAVSRCLELAKVMVAVYLHDQEQLGARAPRGLLLLKNISQIAWDDAMAAREERMDELERRYYGGLAVLAGMGPSDVDAKLIALSQLPLGFDLEKFTSLLMYGYALAFGYDPREFWPVSGGQLGTATETEVQHEKATGKGGLDFALAYQENLQRLLPPTLQFEFEQRDDTGAILAAQLEQAQAAGPLGMYNTGLQADASVITREEVRMLLAERGLIPEEWTLYEEEVTSTDTEAAEESADLPTPTPDGTVPEAAPVARYLDTEPVRRAMRAYPHEVIIQRQWPSGRERVLWRPGRKLWSGSGAGNGSGVQRAGPKALAGLQASTNGDGSVERAVDRAGYTESQHPRDEHGRFTSSGSSGSGRVSQSFKTTYAGSGASQKRGKEAVAAASESIDYVHGTMQMESIPVTVDAKNPDLMGSGGFYDTPETGSRRIVLNPDGRTPTSVLVHESGHMMAKEMFGDHTARSKEFEGWWKAVSKSEDYNHLKDNSKKDFLPEQRKYILSKAEVWARSYTQYVATRSGNEKLTNDLATEIQRAGHIRIQWSQKDFEPVAAAMDKMFRDKGAQK